MSMTVNSATSGITTSTEWPPANSTPQSDVLSSVSQLLGVSTSQLQSTLSSGQSLQSVASSEGVSSSQLVATIAQSLESSKPNLSSSQASTMATNISQRVGGSGGGHHHRHGGGSSSGSSSASSSSSTNPTTELLQLLGAAPSTSSTSSTSLTSSLLSPTTQSGQVLTGNDGQEVDMYL